MNYIQKPLATAVIDLAHEPAFSLGVLRVVPSARETNSPRGSDSVEPRVMQALVCLARAEGAVVSRDDLIQSCWGGRVVSEDAINRCIAKLRQLAENDGEPFFVVETVPRVGYRLSARGKPVIQEDQAPPTSLCVLPFANMSDEPQQEYFADGITDDIITDLHKISCLFVVARNTAFTFKGRNVDIIDAARQLKVTHILEGSVRKAGGRVRITAQLVDGATGGHVWAERYDRDLNDIFALQEEISHAIARALKLKLRPEEDRSIGDRGTNNPEAYDFYLMARRFYGTGGEGENRSLEAVARLSKRATDIDPNYAHAWSLLGAAQTALHFVHGREDSGLPAIERALALHPDLPEAIALKSRHLWQAEHKEEAWALIDRALSLDPESRPANYEAAWLNYQARQFPEAIRYFEKAATLSSNCTGDLGMLLSSYAAVGDRQAMERTARLVVERTEEALARDHIDVTQIGCGVGALAALGELERARGLIERGLLMDPSNMRMRYNFACGVALHLHDNDMALMLLEPVFASMSAAWLNHVMIDPDLDVLRHDPRFQRMLADAETRIATQAGMQAA
jgi:adenylate cyclase